MRLIDIFCHNNELYAWLFEEENYFFPCRFFPTLYAYGKQKEKLLPLLYSISYTAEKQQRMTLEGEKYVLAISTSVSKWNNLLQKLRTSNCELYNSDIPLEEHYLFSEDVFPGATVSAVLDQNDRIVMMTRMEDPFDDYRLPALKKVRIEAITSQSLRQVGVQLEKIRYNEKEYDFDTFFTLFSEDDPDIIVAENLHLIAILHAVRKNHPHFSFSRFGRDIFATGGRSFESYGQIHYKDPPTLLKGRLHFSPRNILYGKWDIEYPFELARICRVPLQRINHRSIGYGVSNIQQYYAFQKGILIPHKMTCVERWRSGLDLFQADRGSLIYEPRVGFHTDVAEIDFVSLFPSLMVKYNISPETMFCSCCVGNRVPELSMNICTRYDGIMRQLLRPIIAQRQKYKQLGYDQKANALKGLLVCSFGYMGFRKSKLARIECHQAILAYARRVLLLSSQIAEELGYSVVHGITDSLWVKKKPLGDVSVLISAIEKRTGLKIKLEGTYRWIVFLPSTQNDDVPVPTRYYGVFDDGEIKVRGIELRRHDTPPFILQMQQGILDLLSHATSWEEFVAQKHKAHSLLQSVIHRIGTGKIAPEELAISVRLNKIDYKANIAQKQVIEELRGRGFTPKAGQYIRYVIQDDKKYSTASEHYSKERYIELTKRAYRSLFLGFEKREEYFQSV